MIRSSTLYDILKWIALVFLPALAVCIASLGEVYQWHSQQWVATCNIIGMFIGALLQHESKHYQQQQSKRLETSYYENTQNN